MAQWNEQQDRNLSREDATRERDAHEQDAIREGAVYASTCEGIARAEEIREPIAESAARESASAVGVRAEATREAGAPFMHAHVHEHADGTVHSHYHTHAGGNVAHEHAPVVAHTPSTAVDHEHPAGGGHTAAAQHVPSSASAQPCTHAHETEGEHASATHHAPARIPVVAPDQIALDPALEAHTPGVIPEHSHVTTTPVRPPLEAVDLAYSYPHQSAHVFEGLSLQAHPGSMLAILGNNGAGKSTLLDLLAGITAPAAGKVLVNGEDAHSLSRREMARRIAYVAQQQRVPHLTVYDEVLLGRKPHISWTVREADREIVGQAIVDLELEQFTNRYCDELSGGERQKVFIARALAQEPHILILDEPTSALDPKNQLEVLDVVRRVTRAGGLATVLVLHDVNLALRFCDRFMLMRGGEVIASGDRSVVTGEALTRTYGTAFKIVEIDEVPVAIPQAGLWT